MCGRQRAAGSNRAGSVPVPTHAVLSRDVMRVVVVERVGNQGGRRGLHESATAAAALVFDSGSGRAEVERTVPLRLVEEAEDLAAGLLPAALVVVHDAHGGGEHDVTELARRKEVHHPLLELAVAHVEAGGDHAALVDATVELNDDLARAVVVHDGELADVAWEGRFTPGAKTAAVDGEKEGEQREELPVLETQRQGRGAGLAAAAKLALRATVRRARIRYLVYR